MSALTKECQTSCVLKAECACLTYFASHDALVASDIQDPLATQESTRKQREPLVVD